MGPESAALQLGKFYIVFKTFERNEIASQGQNLALAGFCVSTSLDSDGLVLSSEGVRGVRLHRPTQNQPGTDNERLQEGERGGESIHVGGCGNSQESHGYWDGPTTKAVNLDKSVNVGPA